MKIYGQFLLRIEAITCMAQTLFVVSKDEWDTKEGTGKSYILRTAVPQKAPPGLKQR